MEFDKQRYNIHGFDKNGFDKNGFDIEGYNKLGFNEFGFDKSGYNENGFDKFGFDRAGFSIDGSSKNTYKKQLNNKTFFSMESQKKHSTVKKYNKNGFDYSYILKYFPKRYNVNPTDDFNRNLIYNFKDGYNTEYYLTLFVNFIKETQLEQKNTVLLPIPASTSLKNEIRFSRILSEIAGKTIIENGFDYIKIINDREAQHLSNNKVINKKNYTINYSKIKNKNIILIDDIITTGSGFSSLAKDLISHGANNVQGLFLGKTQNDKDWLECYPDNI